MKIKIHNSLVLEEEFFQRFLLNDIYIEEVSINSGELYFYSKESNSAIGYLAKNGSLKEHGLVSLTPLNLSWLKSLKWWDLIE